MNSLESLLKKAAEVLQQPNSVLNYDEVAAFVGSFLKRADTFVETAHRHGSPLYVFEERALLERAAQFAAAFKETLGDIRIFYAVKSNNHPVLVSSLVRSGLGLDVSSGLELELALRCSCPDIIFSGPGKTDKELQLAVRHSNHVTVLIDSFGELDRLEKAAAELQTQINAGVRLTTDDRGLWRKFGIPLARLDGFMQKAIGCSHVLLGGLQFHTSWNLDPGQQVDFIARLGESLQNLAQNRRELIKFIDIGGGYWPPQGEWLQWAGTSKGRLHQALLNTSFPSTEHYKLSSSSITTFATKIGAAVQRHVVPYVDCLFYAEPGRWLCNDAMHILLTVVDKKSEDLVITDGGTNIIGWERFETDYFPVINLSRPSKSEHKCFILGSLCTPHDVWGYGYFGKGIEPGDLLLIPNQGAYTYSLRQEFIKPLPEVVALCSAG
jgi:diaminopimelate decarboxylase